MRIGIIGLGSIGRRHADCIMQIGNHEIFALRTKKGSLHEALKGVVELYNWDDFINADLDGIIISNPTALHFETLKKIEPYGIPCLVEKPLHSTSEVYVSSDFQSKIIVAYCLRFHPLYQFIEKELTQKKNALRSLSFERAYYLPLWHPYADYRKEYAARKDMGGGVVRTLSHEIDLVISWLGELSLIRSEVAKQSDLEIDVEDFAEFVLRDKRGIEADFHLDFINKINTNRGRIRFTDDTWYFDFSRGSLWSENTKSTILSFDSKDIDAMYIEQMRDFIQFIESGSTKNCRFEIGMESLKLIDKIAAH